MRILSTNAIIGTLEFEQLEVKWRENAVQSDAFVYDAQAFYWISVIIDI